VGFDWQEFFKKQIEECRELERQAVNADDRVFWQKTTQRWEEQLRLVEAQTRKNPSQREPARQVLSEDGAEA
jgi:hypothetical protein